MVLGLFPSRIKSVSDHTCPRDRMSRADHLIINDHIYNKYVRDICCCNISADSQEEGGTIQTTAFAKLPFTNKTIGIVN